MILKDGKALVGQAVACWSSNDGYVMGVLTDARAQHRGPWRGAVEVDTRYNTDRSVLHPSGRHIYGPDSDTYKRTEKWLRDRQARKDSAEPAAQALRPTDPPE